MVEAGKGGKLCVVIDVPEMVGYLNIHVPMRERGMGHPLGVFRNWISGLGVQ
jgi:hypothetical protein